MPTAIVKSIGATGRQYADMQLFEDAIPADITSTDESWTGECYNDAEFTVAVNFSGTTTDATRFIKLTTATDQSFIDHADAATNPQAYDQSKGVGLSVGTYNIKLLDVNNNYVTVEKIQFEIPSGSSFTACIGAGPVTNMLVQNIIAHSKQTTNARIVSVFGVGSRFINSLVITNGTNNHICVRVGNTCEAFNVTAISPSDVTSTGTGFGVSYSNNVVKNCASFGFATDYSASGWDTGASSHNASDSTGNPGGNSQDSLTFADQYETVTTSGMDFRVKSGSGLIDNGTRDQTNTNDLDIVGQDRSTTTPTIGHWEFISAVAGTILTQITNAYNRINN